ncbi:MAG: DegT/DnrJ/EryC1/StrS family aminotransferase [Armatimonadetes bacterium]|jgi:dTDP-4-amino-4,6-dideoxygalactose transaminase|nr:DegT/DnrJ/EryC1/StrS family aminotransferase [Armatimonadota bacterium]MDI9584932.1 DegT/DnrJ/EryC1/StrS family aminotransferase [Acidobacteriota bacterium]
MDAARRKQLISDHKPAVLWPGEPLLGGWYGEEEIEVVVKTIRASMDWTVGFGFICPEIVEFEQAFAQYSGTPDAVSINGAGTGLDMAVMCLDLEPGDEIIAPSVNFRAAPTAIVGQGGTWIPGEIDPRTFQLDPADVERKMSPRTRAILPTHMNGMAAPIADYLEIAERHPHPKHGPAKVIGDAARACGAGYKGKKLGAMEWMTVFSFHTQKNMTTLGEGGMVTCHDPEMGTRLRAIRQFGGADGWGSNYKLTKVQAAVGMVQLRKLDEMVGNRRRLGMRRNEILADVPELTCPYIPDDVDHSFYLYTMLVPREWAGEKRDALCRIMGEEYNVGCVVANPCLHKTNPFLMRHVGDVSLPVSEEIADRLFCPSLHPTMTDEQNEFICAALIETVEKLK